MKTNDCYAVRAFPPQTLGFVADCIVDGGGGKPTVSVDCTDLLALMGWGNAECCWHERKGRFKVFSCTACV